MKVCFDASRPEHQVCFMLYFYFNLFAFPHFETMASIGFSCHEVYLLRSSSTQPRKFFVPQIGFDSLNLLLWSFVEDFIDELKKLNKLTFHYVAKYIIQNSNYLSIKSFATTGSFKSSLVCHIPWSGATKFNIRSVERNGVAGQGSIHRFQVSSVSLSLSVCL